MKIKSFILIIILLFNTQGLASASTQLSQTEILQIFQTITSQPKKAWIPAGTIRANHVEYKSMGGFLTGSTVLVKHDGNRFYWEINIDSHTKQTDPQQNHESLELSWNKKRIFVWDGQRYIKYFGPANQATVIENPSNTTTKVSGPLTAGIIPWGYGIYTFESLSNAQVSGEIDEQQQVNLTMQANGLLPQITLVLDSTKDYALISCSVNYNSYRSKIINYDNYAQFSDIWVPTAITIDKYDSSRANPLVSRDEWDFTYIDSAVPPAGSFQVTYDTDALIEYFGPAAGRSLKYYNSNRIDTEALLYKKLQIAAAADTQTHNCATVSIKYIADKLNKDVNDASLAEMIEGPNGQTSLYAVKQFAQNLGLHCLAVKTNLQTLKDSGIQAILHLPKSKHYVVLSEIDDENAWIVDLDNSKFYYPTKIEQLDLDWSEGTALLISETPVLLTGTFSTLNDSELQNIIGGFPNYSCTHWLQQGGEVGCSEPFVGLCGDIYHSFFGRLGCEENPTGGTCTAIDLPDFDYSHCIEDPWDPINCTITGEWYRRYMRACN